MLTTVKAVPGPAGGVKKPGLSQTMLVAIILAVAVGAVVAVSSWSQAYLKVNGTVTARGFGSSPDAITFVESNSSGNIVFQAIFPASNFFGASYSVDIHVYTPVSAQFNTVQIVTVNGNLQVSSISTSSLTLTDTNGAITSSNISATTMTATDTNGSVNLTAHYAGALR